MTTDSLDNRLKSPYDLGSNATFTVKASLSRAYISTTLSWMMTIGARQMK